MYASRLPCPALPAPSCRPLRQPQAYRSIIDKVVASVRPDFEENGIDENVLIALQQVRALSCLSLAPSPRKQGRNRGLMLCALGQSWEAKLALSRVADFSSDPRLGAYQAMLPPLLDESAKKDVSVAADGSSTSVKQEDGLAASTSTSLANGKVGGMSCGRSNVMTLTQV